MSYYEGLDSKVHSNEFSLNSDFKMHIQFPKRYQLVNLLDFNYLRDTITKSADIKQKLALRIGRA